MVSFANLGRELGVTKQSVADAFARRGWTKSNAPAPQPEPATAPQPQKLVPQVDGAMTDEEIARIRIAVHRRAVMIQIAALNEAGTALDRDRGKVPAMTLARLQQTAEAATKMLGQLLHIPADETADGLEQMTISIMTADQAVQLQASHDREDMEDDFGAEDEADFGNPVLEPEPPPTSILEASAQQDGGVEGPAAPMPPADHRALREWLVSLGVSHGRRHLRQLAASLGLREVGPGTDVDYLVDAIMHVAHGDRMIIRNHLAVIGTVPV